MAGVAGPLISRDVSGGVRFLMGLFIGGAFGGAVLAIPAYAMSLVLGFAINRRLGLILLAVGCMLLGAADLAGRTPHVWRQVPQGYVHRLQPGGLGLVWGVDLGLLFTTQKVVSLIWAALLATILLSPDLTVILLVSTGGLSGLTAAAWLMFRGKATSPMSGWNRIWIMRTRQASGITLLALSALSLVQAT